MSEKEKKTESPPLDQKAWHETQKVLSEIGEELGAKLPGFYGKITFNIQNGVCKHSNLEKSFRPLGR